jgi:hypothetical protein
MKQQSEIRFQDLSLPLRIAIIAAWIGLIYNVGLFLLGFMIGLLGL